MQPTSTPPRPVFRQTLRAILPMDSDVAAFTARQLAIVGLPWSGKFSVARARLLAGRVEPPVPGPQLVLVATVKPGERQAEVLAQALLALLPSDTSVLRASRQVAIEDLLRVKKSHLCAQVGYEWRRPFPERCKQPYDVHCEAGTDQHILSSNQLS